MHDRKQVLAASATLAFALAIAAPAQAFNIGEFFKGVGNVLTGGMISLAEGAAKIAKGKKVTPGDIVNIATGGVAGAVKDAVKTAHAVPKMVHSAFGGIANTMRDIVKRMGVNLPGVGKGLLGGKGGGPLGILSGFAQTFTSSLPKLFAGGVKKLGLKPGQGLFRAGLGLVQRALDQARQAALRFARQKGLRMPNLGGLTSFIRSKMKSAFDLARKVAKGVMPRKPGQFVALVKPGTVSKALGGWVKALPKKVRGK